MATILPAVLNDARNAGFMYTSGANKKAMKDMADKWMHWMNNPIKNTWNMARHRLGFGVKTKKKRKVGRPKKKVGRPRKHK